MRQVYLAYLGASKRIDLEKAQKICGKLSISQDELRKVKRLKIAEPLSLIRPSVQAEHVPKFEPREVRTMIAGLRKRYGLSATSEGYQQLAVRIGVLHISSRELQMSELGQIRLREDQMERLDKMAKGRR
ncbi:hypothetical protein HYR53_04040 [Candidatus Acetothermia bacterium]|nr:hypothetical protein [Candidatus Acetothermia bacterium]